MPIHSFSACKRERLGDDVDARLTGQAGTRRGAPTQPLHRYRVVVYGWEAFDVAFRTGEQLHGGFVTYSTAAKTKLLGVSEVLLQQRDVVCADVAIAMAQGALERSPGNVAVAITGVAGPKRDEDGNPVGFVCITAVRDGYVPVQAKRHYGNIGRSNILEETMADALHEILRQIEDGDDTGTPNRSFALWFFYLPWKYYVIATG